MDLYKKKKTYITYLIIACLASASNVLFCYNKVASTVVVLFEVIILILLLLQKKMADYICFFMFFMCNCIEYSAFAGQDAFYGFKNFRIAGINIGIIMLLPVFVYFIKYCRELLVVRKNTVSQFCYGLIAINIIAAIVGMMLIFINDNNIQSLGNITYSFIQKGYGMIFLPVAFMIAIYEVFRNYEYETYKLSLGLQVVLCANVFQMIVSITTGVTGNYGYLSTMQVSIVNFLIPFLILVSLYKKEVIYPRFTAIVGFLGSILAISYNANGKLIIMFFVCVIIFTIKSLKDGSVILKAFVTFAILGSIVCFGTFINYLIQNPLFNAKLGDVKTLLNIFSGNWIENLSQSPRVRVEEFRDIIIEYGNKPWLFLTGKGYLGSIVDHTGYFRLHLAGFDGFVSEAEWINGIYYNLHEIASYILLYGFIGLVFLIRTINRCVGIFRKSFNIWLLIGMYWFVLFYGYSFTISTFGCVSLLYGLFSNEFNDEMDISK